MPTPPFLRCMLDATCREKAWNNFVGLVDQAAFVTIKLFGGNVARYGDKIARQMQRRGWTDQDISDTISKPADTAKTINKATGNTATKYYNSDGHYVVRDDVTDEIIQISDRNEPGWIDDLTDKPIKPRP